MNKWEKRFMDQAKLVSTWSKDPKHQVGAVIVDNWNRQLSIGYNGPPRFVDDENLNQQRKVLRTLHAELNAILNCPVGLMGTTMYIYPFNPCAQCAAAIIQKRLSKVIYCVENNLRSWKASQDEAKEMLTEAGIFLYKLEDYIPYAS